MNGDLLARANVARLAPQYKSKGEAWWANMGPILLGDELGTRVLVMHYEPFSVNLPGGRYTPDFYHILADGREVWVEVKGSVHEKGYRDARSKLRAAAELHPQHLWYEAIVGGQGCEKLELIGPEG